jgi:hypothetical protein
VRATRLRSAAAAVLAAAALASCSSDPAAGLNGTIGAGTSAGVDTLSGLPADYTGFLGNHSGHAVVLRSATLWPLKGFRAPRLVHLAVETGLIYISSGNGWPPQRYRHPMARFAGYHLRTGHRAQILYSVVASEPGQYADEGIRVTLLVAGSTVTVNVISPAATCVVRSWQGRCPRSFDNKVFNAANP